MDRPSWVDSLTDSDRIALRLIYHRRMQVADVAREMSVGLEGARSRFARIRSRTGLTTQAAARAFCETEAPLTRPSEAPPSMVHPPLGHDAPASDRQIDAVCEERTVFDHAMAFSSPQTNGKTRRNGLTTLQRLLAIASVAVLISTLLSQSVQVSKAFQALANLIMPVN